jgi:hypothetical protein
MNPRPESVAPILVLGGELGREKRKQLLIVLVLTIALTGCGLPARPDVRAYNACITRHPQELAVCEGPRQAYEIDPTAFQARAAALGASAGGRYEEPAPVAYPASHPCRSVSAPSLLVKADRCNWLVAPKPSPLRALSAFEAL